MSWEDWIDRNNYNHLKMSYDDVIDLTIDKYNLSFKSRCAVLCDKRHFVIEFWNMNRSLFSRYHNQEAIARQLNINRSSLVHYYNKRKKSNDFEYNTHGLSLTISKHLNTTT